MQERDTEERARSKSESSLHKAHTHAYKNPHTGGAISTGPGVSGGAAGKKNPLKNLKPKEINPKP